MHLFVRKTGRVCQIYETPFDDYNNPPEGTPQTVSVDSKAELEGTYRGSTITWIERPQLAAAPAKPEGLNLGALIGALAGMNIPQEAKDAMLAKHRPDGQALAPVVTGSKPLEELAAEVSYQDKMIQEFRLVLASIGNSYSKEEAEAIGNFILAVDPSLEAQLVGVKQQSTTRRFTL